MILGDKSEPEPPVRRPTPKCAKCGEEMQEGYIPDAIAEGDCRIGRWVEGKPEYGIFGELKGFGQQQHPILSYRCPKCGYLELYALG